MFKKLLPFADVLFTIAGLVALGIARLDPHQILFWPGLVLAVGGIGGAFFLRRSSRGKRKEVMLTISRDDWTVEKDQNMPISSRLDVPETRHGKGSDINVRVEQIEFKQYDLEEPVIENGNITIRFRNTNFPIDPRIPLRIYVAGRG
jgi:hypothetical protein